MFEPRVGALSVDRRAIALGVPAIPIPLTSDEVPELPLFKRDRRQGVVKLALVSYDAETGELAQSLDPVYAFSERTEWTLLLFISWEENDLIPPPEDDAWINDGTFD